MTGDTAHGTGRRVRDAADTKARLIDAARTVTCTTGVAGASGRLIAAEAAVNQALIFYHFHTVVELIEAASNHFVDRAVADYRVALSEASTVDELMTVTRMLHQQQNNSGNVAFMTQILAAAGQDPAIGRAAAYAITVWTAQTRAALSQTSADTVLEHLIDLDELAELITASLIGIELYATAGNAEPALGALAAIGRLVDSLITVDPITRKIITASARRL